MRDPANRDEVVNIIVNVQGPSESVARQIMTLYFEPGRGVFPKQAELDIKGVGNVVEFMAHAGTDQSSFTHAGTICRSTLSAGGRHAIAQRAKLNADFARCAAIVFLISARAGFAWVDELRPDVAGETSPYFT
jgi:hypothetical protein